LLLVAEDGTISLFNVLSNTVCWFLLDNNTDHWLIAALKFENITFHLPISSVSDAATHNGVAYLTTNGPNIPSIVTLNMTGLTVTPTLNHYRGPQIFKVRFSSSGHGLY
jgi:hypothetical protein